MQQFAVIVRPDPEDGGFVAMVPGRPDVIGQGETEEEALKEARAALESQLEAAGNEVITDNGVGLEGTNRPFDAEDSLEALADQQGVDVADDFDSLLGDFWPDNEGENDFVSALREWRSDLPAA